MSKENSLRDYVIMEEDTFWASMRFDSQVHISKITDKITDALTVALHESTEVNILGLVFNQPLFVNGFLNKIADLKDKNEIRIMDVIVILTALAGQNMLNEISEKVAKVTGAETGKVRGYDKKTIEEAVKEGE